MKTIIFLTAEADLDSYFQLKKNTTSKFGREIYICADYFSFQKAKHLSLKPRRSLDYYEKSKALRFFQTAKGWTSSWYKNPELNIKYMGISLGEIVALPMLNYFSEILRSYSIATQILNKESPTQVYVSQKFVSSQNQRWTTEDFNLENIILGEVCAERNIPLLELKLRESIKLNIPHLFLPQTLILIVKSFLNLIINEPQKTDYLFFANHYHLNNLKPLIEVALQEKTKYITVGVADVRQSLLLKNNNYHYLAFDTFIRPWDILKSWLSIFIIKYRFKKSPFPSNIIHHPISKYQTFTAKLKYVLECEYPKIILQLNQSQRILKTIRPKVVISVASTDVLGQIITRQAMRFKVPTIVPQHGIAGSGECEYYLGDIIPVWGKVPFKVYQDNGIDPNKLVITGCSLFQELTPIKNAPHSDRVFLFLPTAPVGSGKLFCSKLQEEIYAEFIKTARIIPNSKAIIRLHPSSRQDVPYRVARGLRYNLKDVRKLSLSETLDLADIVIGQQTSALIEALISGKKVLYLDSFLKANDYFGPLDTTKLKIKNFTKISSRLNKYNQTALFDLRKGMISEYLNNLNKDSSKKIFNIATGCLDYTVDRVRRVFEN